jgi:hypothetical protein
MICKVCQQSIEDIEGAHAFKTGGRVRFHTHAACHELVRGTGVAVGQTIRQLVALRKPGLLESPAVRSIMAVIRELRQ